MANKLFIKENRVLIKFSHQVKNIVRQYSVATTKPSNVTEQKSKVKKCLLGEKSAFIFKREDRYGKNSFIFAEFFIYKLNNFFY